ncbi:MAG: hypothetical protein PHT79_11695 [Syntrophomonadaceae bacterium]|nr:hypothetical protein [Syntrophomonadaceae bacterium]
MKTEYRKPFEGHSFLLCPSILLALANPDLTAVKNPDEEKEMKRFAHQFINELWQTDALQCLSQGR